MKNVLLYFFHGPRFVMSAVNNEKVVNLLETLVFPVEGSTLRYNDGTTAVASAARILTQEININWNTAVTDRNIPAAEAMVFLFRDPLRSVVFYDHNVSRSIFTYECADTDFNENFFYPNFGGEAPCNIAWANGTSSFLPHGSRLYAMKADGRSGLWCDNDGTNTSTIEVTFDDATTLAGCSVNFFYWTGSTWFLSEQQLCVNGTASYRQTTWSVVGGHYTAVSFTTPLTGTSATYAQLKLVCVGGVGPAVWCHRPIPNINELLPIVESIRVVAGSLTWLNESPALDESGKIVSVTVAPPHPWSNLTVSQSNLTSLSGYKSRLAKNGLYTFLKPAAGDDAFVYDDTSIVKSALRSYSYIATGFKPTATNSPYIVASMNVANTNARDTSVTITHAIEFITDSKIQESRLPDASPEEWVQAINMLGPLQQHHDANVDLRTVLNPTGLKRQRVLQQS